MLARRASVKVKYKGIDITSDIEKDLESFSYTDNASGNADDINFNLKDDHLHWINKWFPEKGDSIDAKIITHDWRFEGDKQVLPCGRFFLDQPEYSGRPRTLTLKAISTPTNNNFTTTERSKTWRNITVRSISQDIAKRAGLDLFWDSPKNPKLDTEEQTENSDMSFLAGLCEREGLSFKVTDKKIIIFDEETYEKRPTVGSFRENNSTLLSYNFKSTMVNTAYIGCNVKYYDAKKNRKIEFLYLIGESAAVTEISDDEVYVVKSGDTLWAISKKNDVTVDYLVDLNNIQNRDLIFPGQEIKIRKSASPNTTVEGKIYQLNSRVKTREEARRLAQKTLRNLNKKEHQATIQLVGNAKIVGGCCINLLGFGMFSGKYYVEKATHNIGNGYTVDVDARKILEGY
ncbi:LysM peptidoglycan-binding domain-containing protein [Bacillaceae bacterium IKA-2]|nr:LysM peptidoglycan-binding domain-containing protein [Bacillaceae bacterium IKA-2]